MSEGYSLKEMVQEVRDSQKSHEISTVKIMATLESMELQLKKVCGTVENHETRLISQEGFKGKVMAVWAVAIFVLTTVANKVLAQINF